MTHEELPPEQQDVTSAAFWEIIDSEIRPHTGQRMSIGIVNGDLTDMDAQYLFRCFWNSEEARPWNT